MALYLGLVIICLALQGTLGLGFNIKGGKDIPHLPGDGGIFVTKIRETGAAAEDGKLKEGDKILEINDHSLLDVRHEEAVNYFRNSTEVVKLKVIPGAEAKLRASLQNEDITDNDRSPKSTPTIWYIAGAVGIAALLGFVGYRFYYRRV